MALYDKLKERGFTFPELLIAVTLMVLFLMYVIPAYRMFNYKAELGNTANRVRDQVRIAQNKSLNGVVPGSNTQTYWVFHTHTLQSGWADHYEVAGCNPADNIFDSSTCFNTSTANYVETAMPPRFHIYPVAISPEPSTKYASTNEANLFFSSISGDLKVYGDDGTFLGDSVNIKITSDDYPTIYYIVSINSQGNVSMTLNQ